MRKAECQSDRMGVPRKDVRCYHSAIRGLNPLSASTYFSMGGRRIDVKAKIGRAQL